jgi:hypothetical protein
VVQIFDNFLVLEGFSKEGKICPEWIFSPEFKIFLVPFFEKQGNTGLKS